MPRRPMGAQCLTLPSCPPTWARSAVLTNSACRSWVNGSSPVVRCCLPGRRDRRVRPVVSPLRMGGCAARQRDPAAGARTAGVAPDDVLVTIRRYRCTGCGHVSRQDTRRVLIEDPHRFDGVRVIGVDEHCWRHTRRGDKYVTVIIDLTPIRDGTGPARLLDMVEGRSKQVFKTWLAERDTSWRDCVEVVAMDGFTGFKTATSEELPDAVAVMDPLHVVRLAGDALDQCRRRVQQVICGHRGRKGDPLYAARRTLHTGAALLTEKQQARLEALFAVSEHVEVEATWGIYQRMIAAYREPDKKHGKAMMQGVIDSVASGVPATLTEIRKLGRTLKQRATDILAFFDRPGTSNGPIEAINGRLENLRGRALGFRNLTNYIARSLLEAGGFRPRLHPRLR